ncbi:MAG: GGDEF domain-containing protein [Burkholderiales bacterium]|nr:GGDEF domain-containing protein [Burkholderiales bacterium]MDE2565321.1 GGDEF domain-containing protein [Burkholderiales bacterium]
MNCEDSPQTRAPAAPAAARRADGPGHARDDWDGLFRAVVARLRHLLAAPPEVGSLRGGTAECLQALEQLHGQLAAERQAALGVAHELVQARAALAEIALALAQSQARERRERHRATHDALTALPNREHFDRRVAQALEPAPGRRPTLAVLYLDLDGFKPINDRHGHDTGDALLRIVAARLTGAVRAGDLVCRIGGDEFACLVADPPAVEQLGRLARKLFEAVSAPLQVGALELRVQPSIGIARCPDDGDTAALLLRHADGAMYRAKRRRLGVAFFDRRSDT